MLQEFFSRSEEQKILQLEVKSSGSSDLHACLRSSVCMHMFVIFSIKGCLSYHNTLFLDSDHNVLKVHSTENCQLLEVDMEILHIFSLNYVFFDQVFPDLNVHLNGIFLAHQAVNTTLRQTVAYLHIYTYPADTEQH